MTKEYLSSQSDLFHIQQDITKGLTGPLARQVGRAKKSLDKRDEEKEKSLQAFRQKLEKLGSAIEPKFRFFREAIDKAMMLTCLKLMA